MYSVIFFVASLALSVAQQSSPCPEVFNYLPEGSEPGKLNGQLLLNSDYSLNGVWIKLLLDKEVDRVESKFGEVVPRESNSFLIKDRDYNMIPGTPLLIPITIYYPENVAAPNVVGVRLNARVACPSPPKSVASKCPGVLLVNKDSDLPKERGLWQGTIKLSTAIELTGVWVRIVLDRPATLTGDFGENHIIDDTTHLISNRNYTFTPDSSIRIHFRVKYNPEEPVPEIRNIYLNARTLCEPSTAGSD